MRIKESDKILIIAPHPDDEVIALGGFIAKYHSQIDVLCINSSGVANNANGDNAEEIADMRINEFYDVMKTANVNSYNITKIFGVPPMIKQIKKHFKEYLNQFDYSKYDYIFVPHEKDGHVEHRYVGNVLLKKLLKRYKYKKNLKIVRYELWSPILEPNDYEDITDYVSEKQKLIDTYKSRTLANYGARILALNKYRTLNFCFFDYDKYLEAYYVEPVRLYMRPKILKHLQNYFRNIFSVYNEYGNNSKHKVIKLLFCKIKIKCK